MIRWAIGYDHRESGAFHAFAHSLQARSSKPISITPVDLRNLPVLDRPRDPLQSNDFAFSRFLVPWMFDYEGWVVFSDCDMLCLRDPAELWDLRDERYTIQCVKLNYQPETDTKYLGATQTTYDRKCWSSLMLMNCARLKCLTPELVNSFSGLYLHQFRFLPCYEIGGLPPEWNHLVGHSQNDSPAIIHWTEGGPWFRDYEDVDFADLYRQSHREMSHIESG